jgi:hypothetical protein
LECSTGAVSMASIISVGKYDGRNGSTQQGNIKMDQGQILLQNGHLDWIEIAHGMVE